MSLSFHIFFSCYNMNCPLGAQIKLNLNIKLNLELKVYAVSSL